MHAAIRRSSEKLGHRVSVVALRALHRLNQFETVRVSPVEKIVVPPLKASAKFFIAAVPGEKVKFLPFALGDGILQIANIVARRRGVQIDTLKYSQLGNP